jgi:hypothetical protein
VIFDLTMASARRTRSYVIPEGGISLRGAGVCGLYVMLEVSLLHFRIQYLSYLGLFESQVHLFWFSLAAVSPTSAPFKLLRFPKHHHREQPDVLYVPGDIQHRLDVF